MSSRPKIPAEIVRQVKFEAGYQCSVCGETSALEIAHIIPWAQSHDHGIDNLILLCANCHTRADRGWTAKELREFKKHPYVYQKKQMLSGSISSHDLAKIVDHCPGVRHDLTSTSWLPPKVLEPKYPFIGRGDELTRLANQVGEARIVKITGASDIGKKQLVSQFLSNADYLQEISDRIGHPIALLQIDFQGRSGVRPVLRQLAFALGESASPLSHDLSTHDKDSIDAIGDHLIHNLLETVMKPERYRVITVLSGLQRVSDEESLKDLSLLLQSTSMRDGCALLVSQRNRWPDGGKAFVFTPGVEIPTFTPAEGKDLLCELLGEIEVAQDALRELPDGFPLIPGLLRLAALAAVAGGKPLDGESLALQILDTYEHHYSPREFLQRLGYSDVDKEEGTCPLYTLLAHAIMPGVELRKELICKAELPVPPLVELREFNWINAEHHVYENLLTDFAIAVLRTEIILMYQRSQDVALEHTAEALGRLVRVHMAAAEDAEQAIIKMELEKALAWLVDNVQETILVTAIKKQLILHSIQDTIPPFDAIDFADIVSNAPPDMKANPFDQMLGGVIHLSRYGTNREEFIDSLKNILTIVLDAKEILGTDVATLDLCLFIGAKRFNALKDILGLRQSLLPYLTSKFDDWCSRDIRAAKFTISWALNAAMAAIFTGQSDDARDFFNTAEKLLDGMPNPRRSHQVADSCWLHSRAAQIESRLAITNESRRKALNRMMEFAQSGLENSPEFFWWRGYYLKMARNAIDESRDDREKEEIINHVMDSLRQIYGSEKYWGGALNSQSASFLTHAATRLFQMDLQKEILDRAEKLMCNSESSVYRSCEAGDVRPLYVLVRIFEKQADWLSCFGRTDEAEVKFGEAIKLVELAKKSNENARAWRTLIRLHMRKSQIMREFTTDFDPEIFIPHEINSTIRTVLKSVQKWVANRKQKTAEEGRLELLRCEIGWRAQLSLSDYVKESLRRKKQFVVEWNYIPPDERVRAIDTAFNQRKATIKAIRRDCGDFPELWITEAWQTSHWQRQRYINGAASYDIQATLTLFEEAISVEHFPYSWKLYENLAKYLRYIWQNAEAIKQFNRVIDCTLDGAQRYRCYLAVSEAALTTLAHYTSLGLETKGDMSLESLLEVAAHNIGELEQTGAHSARVLALREFYRLEAGESIDWGKLDGSYELLIDDDLLRNFPGALRTLAIMQDDIADEPQDLVDTWLLAPTKISRVESIGKLYLRSSELYQKLCWDDERRLHAVTRAFYCCQATRIFEQAYFGYELPTSRMARAKTILAAYDIVGDPNPFHEFDFLEGKTQLHLAQSLLQSARDRSVGGFRGAVEKEFKRCLTAIRKSV